MILPGLPPGIARIDCGSCHKCCRGEQLIVLVDGDSPANYDCYEIEPGIFALRRAANGDCIYLGDKGCTIWGRHPTVCKVFDCAGVVKQMDAGAFDHIGPRLDGPVIQEGRRRLKMQEKAKR